MSAKKVAFPLKPEPKPAPTKEAWVDDRHEEEGETTRYTIDLPVALHRRMKAVCALQGKKMSVIVREIFEREFPA